MTDMLKRLKQISIVAVLLATVQEWQRDKTAQIAGSLTFFIILSLAPLLVIMVSLLGLATDQDTIEGQLYDQLADVIGEASADLLQNMVQSVNQSESGGLAALISSLTLLYGATRVFGQLQEALNRTWGIAMKQDQSFWRTIKRRSLAAAMLPVTGIVLLIALVLDTVFSVVASYFGDQIPNILHIYVLQGISLVVSTMVITLLFAAIYKYLPDAKIAWDDVFTGAAFTAILFTIGQFLLSIYLTQSSVTSTYGAAGTFMVILLWVYYSTQIFLFGAEFTQVFARHRNRRIEPAAYAYRLHQHEQPSEST